MKIEYRKGDLFTTDINILVHGANDCGIMGSGIALPIKNKFPEAYNEYRDIFLTEGLEGGSIIPVETNEKTIINAITQNFYGRDGKRYAKYDWIADCFHRINKYAANRGEQYVAMPQIGAGLGGGSWEVISAIIESEMTDVIPVVYILE